MEEIFKTIKEAILRTIDKLQNLLILLILLSLGLSFLSYKNKILTFPTESPNYYFVGLSGILLVLTLFVFFRAKKFKKLKKDNYFHLNNIELNVKVGNIQDADKDKEEYSVVLPVNTTFTDECITDKKSALGSFFDKYHSSKIPSFSNDLQQILKENGIEKVSSGRYTPSTVVVLPEKYSLPAKIILVASTEKSKNEGFITSPTIICDCIYNVFRETADMRISTINIPIIGSGHGGLELTEALNLLVLGIKFQSKRYNHIKKVIIYVRDCDKGKINASFINSFKI